MSAPHVVGVAALLESCNPDLTSQDKWDIMCDPLNVKAYNETKYVGVGIVSADLSLAAGCQVCTDPPVADFSGVPLSGDLPLQVSFTDLSTNNPTAWDWDFGDGSPHAYTKNPVHTYNTANVYTVTLTATNDCGYDVEQKPNYIEVTESEDPPIAAFEGSPTSGSIPLEVTFTDLSTQGPTSWTWDFGDGSPVSYDRNPVHTYTVADIYSVTLTVSNAFGSDDTTEVDYIDAYEGGGTMHVHDMSVTERWVGQNCRGQGTVWVYDDNNEEVEFATVYATATGPFTESVSGITGPDGSVLLETSWDRRCTEEWCFEVTNITHSEYTYEPGDNVVTKECESGPVFRSSDQISEAIPTQYGLSQNYPNPFNPSTEIVFSLPEQGHVKLEVFNISGQKIATLADQFYSAGVHSVTWKADVSSGIYLYRIQANDYTENKKMILLK
jgi:PKD repeat protein